MRLEEKTTFSIAEKSCDSALYNIIFIRSVSKCDRLRKMVQGINQHCIICVRSWFSFRAFRSRVVWRHIKGAP